MTFKKKFLSKSPFKDAYDMIGFGVPLGIAAIQTAKKMAIKPFVPNIVPIAAGIGAAHLIGRGIKKRKYRKKQERIEEEKRAKLQQAAANKARLNKRG